MNVSSNSRRSWRCIILVIAGLTVLNDGCFYAGLIIGRAGVAFVSALELKYFDARGAAEVARLLLAVADEPYRDTRFMLAPGTMEAPEFKEAKESGFLDMNLGRAPVLITSDGRAIGQSKAIERYLARKFNLMGDDDVEAAQVDCISEHCLDVKLAQMRKGFSMFNREKTDEEKAKLKEEWFQADLPSWFEKIEKALALTSGAKGYAVGKKLSYADIVIFALIRDCTIQADQDATLQAAEGCELLMSIADRVATNVKIAKWLETRPVTSF